MASKGVNKVIILGFLGQDPESFDTKDGGKVTTISVATQESWKGKDGNEETKTEWHRIVFFKKLAEIAAQYLTKGSRVYVEGSLTTRKYTTKGGEERSSVEIIASTMQMLGSPSGPNAGRKEDGKTTAKEYAKVTGKNGEFDDDIPW